MERGESLIYGGRIRADDLLGEPDLLRLEGDGYVPGDIKLGAGDEGPRGAIESSRCTTVSRLPCTWMSWSAWAVLPDAEASSGIYMVTKLRTI